MGIIGKDMIEKWIVPHLPVSGRGFGTTVPLTEIVECVLYRLKTGCQWRQLPTKQFFDGKLLHWNTVYYYFNKWSKAGCRKKAWIQMLANNLGHLDLSSIELDGSRTPAKNGGDAVGYQARKASNTTNALFASDSQGVMPAMSTPQEGQRHDLYRIQTLFGEIRLLPRQAGINLEGLSLNADPGFDSAGFRKACDKEGIMANVKPNPRNGDDRKAEPYQTGTHVFDGELHRDRCVTEHANAWMDGFRALLVRFEFSARNWMSLRFIAFSVIFPRKINTIRKV